MIVIDTQTLRRIPTQARAEAKILRVLDAADRLLATGGAGALGTKPVADAAKVSVGTLYNWFEDKEAIAEALALRYWRELSELVAAVAEAAEGGAATDPLAGAFDALAAGFRARPGFLALWFGGLRTEQIRDATRPGRAEVGGSVQRILTVTHPRSDPADRATVARMAVLIGDGILREAFRLEPGGDSVVLAEGGAALQAYIDLRLGGA